MKPLTAKALAVKVAGDAAVAKWQPRLRLHAWNVVVVVKDFTKDPDGADDGDTGQIGIDCTKHSAVIALHPTSPANFRKSWPAFADETDWQITERTVVHELAHLLEEPEQQAFERNLGWLVGIDGKNGIIGSEVHQMYRQAQESRVNFWSDMVIRIDRAGWPG